MLPSTCMDPLQDHLLEIIDYYEGTLTLEDLCFQVQTHPRDVRAAVVALIVDGALVQSSVTGRLRRV